MKKTILMIVVAVVIAGVSGGGVYLWGQESSKKEKMVLQNQIDSLQQKITEPSSESTQGKTQIQPTPDNVNLDAFTDKKLLGENANYVLYMVNPVYPNKFSASTSSEVVVMDKNKNVGYIVNAPAAIELAILADDYNNYIVLSSGTSPIRNGIIISLVDKKVLKSNFCDNAGYNHIFWDGFLLAQTCDHYDGLPDVSEGSSLHWGIIAINLEKDSISDVVKSSVMQDLNIDKIQGDRLYYKRHYVDNLNEWFTNSDKTEELNFDLNILNK